MTVTLGDIRKLWRYRLNQLAAHLYQLKAEPHKGSKPKQIGNYGPSESGRSVIYFHIILHL